MNSYRLALKWEDAGTNSDIDMYEVFVRDDLMRAHRGFVVEFRGWWAGQIGMILSKTNKND